MKRLRSFLAVAAHVEVPVLLVGETGTGKSHLARLLHSRGPRAEAPFVSVNCAGIPDALFESEFFGHERGAFTGAVSARAGLFEVADGGTLLLDEVGELPEAQQAKLLTVLEEGCVRRVGATTERGVDVRVVAATCRTLEDDAVEFRRDLFHRIAVLKLEIPPLRERPEDLAVLVPHVLETLRRKYEASLAVEACGMARLERHRWPGNVRELRHVLEAATILSEATRLRAEDVERALLTAV